MTKIIMPCHIGETNEDMLCIEKDCDYANINVRIDKKWCEPVHININDLIVELLKISPNFNSPIAPSQQAIAPIASNVTHDEYREMLENGATVKCQSCGAFGKVGSIHACHALKEQDKQISPSEQVDKLMAPYQDLLNKVADLSMKLSRMESDLREFEKQRVDPLIADMKEFEADMFQAKAAWCLLEKRIDKLEKDNNIIFSSQTEIAKSVGTWDALHTDMFKRIEKLEYHNKIAGMANAYPYAGMQEEPKS